jgi:hypothetical protein
MTTQPPTDDAPFTTGEFASNGQFKWECGVVYCDDYPQGPFCKCDADKKEGDAKLIAAAMTSAGYLHRSGYDAQKVFEALAEIMSFVDALEEDVNHSAKRLLSLHYNLRRKQKP